MSESVSEDDELELLDDLSSVSVGLTVEEEVDVEVELDDEEDEPLVTEPWLPPNTYTPMIRIFDGYIS